MKSIRCSLFLFDVLCKLNLFFMFLPIRTFMFPPMTKTSCLGMLQTRKDSSLKKVSRSVTSLVLVGL